MTVSAKIVNTGKFMGDTVHVRGYVAGKETYGQLQVGGYMSIEVPTTPFDYVTIDVCGEHGNGDSVPDTILHISEEQLHNAGDETLRTAYTRIEAELTRRNVNATDKRAQVAAVH